MVVFSRRLYFMGAYTASDNVVLSGWTAFYMGRPTQRKEKNGLATRD